MAPIKGFANKRVVTREPHNSIQEFQLASEPTLAWWPPSQETENCMYSRGRVSEDYLNILSIGEGTYGGAESKHFLWCK